MQDTTPPHNATSHLPAATAVTCPTCRYNLTGVLIGGRCPECGTIVGTGLQGNLPTSNWALTSLILGIVSIAGGCMTYGLLSMLCGPLAIVFAFLGYRDVRRARAAKSSHGLATGGLVCGIIGSLLAALMLGMIVLMLIGV